MKHLLDRFGASTEPSPAALERLRRRVMPPSAEASLKHMDARLPNLRAPLRREVRPWRLPRGAAVVMLGLSLLVPCAVEVPTPLPSRAEGSLDALRGVPGFTWYDAGTGHVTWTEDTLHVRWDVGTLRLEAEPGRAWTVETREGTATGVGGTLTVTRDAMGSRWEGPSTCRGALQQDDRGWICLPTHPAGWLARANALLVIGAGPDAALQAARSGLAGASAHDPARGELVAVEVEALRALGRGDEARAAAAAYPSDGPRAAELGAAP